MRIKNLNNSAFTLLEILLSSIIFVVTVAGLFATLSAVRAPVTTKENALSAAVFGKQVLETLRAQVNAGTFYTACSSTGSNGDCKDFSLSVGTHQMSLPAGLSWPSADVNSANANLLTYTVTCPAPCTADSARRVDLAVNW